MADEEDYSSLPIEEKIVHKVWKVRQDGYNALNDQFTKSRSSDDSCFDIFNQRPELVKQIVVDSNVVAQEAGIQALCLFFEFGGSSSNAAKLRNAGIVASLCEKGLSSARAGTKSKSVDALLWMVELLDSGDSIIEQIVPYFDNRLPKLVAASVGAIASIIGQFGCQVASPKPVIPKLAKLFSHADRNVRAQTTILTVEVYKWMRDGLTLLLMDNLRPVQQKELQAEFNKVAEEKPTQLRLTKKQQEELAAQQNNGNEDVDMDVDTSTSQGNAAPAEFDPHLMLEPVEVLLKLPSNLNSQMASSKWKDRVEALEEVHAVLSKAPKLAQDDYTDLVRLFAKCMKDANIQVVQLAADGVRFLSKGLREAFHKYQHLVLAPMIERSKEKKPSVADALAGALDAIYESSSLADVLDETLNGMRHKTPQVKISATDYLRRCLANTRNPPKRSQIDAIMETGVKLLGESQEPIRQAATDMIGTLMKITGERELSGFLEKVDDNRLAKVKAAHDKAEVKCVASKDILPQRPSSKSLHVTAPSLDLNKSSSIPLLRKPRTISSQAIPTKRGATSPAKKPLTSKLPSSVRSLTGRQLVSPTTSSKPPVSEPTPKPPSINAEELLELENLRKEKQQLLEQVRRFAESQAQWEREREQYHEQIKQLHAQVESLQDEDAVKRQALADKDAEILQTRTEAENAKLKILSMLQVIDMLKLNQSTAATNSLIEERRSDPPQPFFSPSRSSEERQEGLAKSGQSELSSRVNRLSIEGGVAQSQRSDNASPSRILAFRSSYSASSSKENISEEDNWKKAAEVTAQLKARIEKMKQRNRYSMNR